MLERLVLADVVSETLGGEDYSRKVEALFFTTFNLDPVFFEQGVLPAFFPGVEGASEEIVQYALSEALEESSVPVAVMHDIRQVPAEKEALTRLAKQQRWEVIPVRPKGGQCFHPKLVLALLEAEGKGPELLVGALSANLTRDGWRRNIEVGVFDVIPLWHSYYHDLMRDMGDLLKSLAGLCGEAGSPAALQAISEAVTNSKLKPYSRRNSGGAYYSRIFHSLGRGAKTVSLRKWLEAEVFRNDWESVDDWRLEVISPYYSEDLAGVLKPDSKGRLVGGVREIRCWLPVQDGKISISEKQFKVVENADWEISWASFRSSSFQDSAIKNADGSKGQRRLHAKLYRFWSREHGWEVLIAGSANATAAGNADKAVTANHELSILKCRIQNGEEHDAKPLEPWLSTREKDDETPVFMESPHEIEDAPTPLPPLTAVLDWKERSINVSVDEPGHIVLGLSEGVALGELKHHDTSAFFELDEKQFAAVLRVPILHYERRIEEEVSGIVLFREINLDARPLSPQFARSADQLLQDWQMTGDDRASHRIETETILEEFSEGGGVTGEESATALFDRGAGLFLAMRRQKELIGRLLDNSEGAVTAGNRRRAENILFGNGPNSLPYLLERVEFASKDQEIAPKNRFDPVDCLLVGLALEDLIRWVYRNHKCLVRERPLNDYRAQEALRNLEQFVTQQVDELSLESIQWPGGSSREFLDWYRDQFLIEV